MTLTTIAARYLLSFATITLLTLLLVAAYSFSQQPSPTPPPAINQSSPPDPNLPQLTHDQKVKLFDLEDQMAQVQAEFQKKLNDVVDPLRKQYDAAVKPLQDREQEYVKLINEEHPGYELQHTGQGLQFVKQGPAPKAEKAEEKKSEKK